MGLITIVTMAISIILMTCQVKAADNAYANNINNCLLRYWPRGVLASAPRCSYSQLCYSDTGKNPAQYAVCYNTKTLIPDFTAHIVTGASGGVGRSGWHNEKGSYAPKPQSSTDDYKEALQKGLYSNFKRKADYYIARGHLTPNADFASASERKLTMVNTNIAPQWQPFNAGNWFKVEDAIRKYAKFFKRKLYVFTGTSGVTKMKLNKKVSVPMYFWKVVCDPMAKAPGKAKNQGQSVLIYAVNNVNDISTGTATGKWNPKVKQTKKRGVIELTSLSQGKMKNLPGLASNCNPKYRGAFLDSFLAKSLS